MKMDLFPGVAVKISLDMKPDISKEVEEDG
jgi:hypothetical protein